MTDFVKIGDPMPVIILPDLAGNPVRLSSFQGKKLLLFMWGSW